MIPSIDRVKQRHYESFLNYTTKAPPKFRRRLKNATGRLVSVGSYYIR
jgi:hypothetical protein